MQLRCPYPEARELPWFGRVVEPDEVIDIPDEVAENFLAAGWKAPDEPVVWPPEPPAPPAEAVPPDPDPAAPPTTPTPVDPPGEQTDAAASTPQEQPKEAAAATDSGTTTTSKKAR